MVFYTILDYYMLEIYYKDNIHYSVICTEWWKYNYNIQNLDSS